MCNAVVTFAYHEDGKKKKDIFSAQTVMSRFDKSNTAPWRARIAIQ